MCGIVGMIDLERQGRADEALVRRMAACIAHRGPDGDGFYSAPDVALGMRRLSIIDIRGSDQPLYSEDHSIALVFNGEIYNYRELRTLLKRRNHILQTEGDGETLIHLYEEYGLNLFSHLRGMYAFALWDSRAGRLVLAVDHIGMKPLYLRQQGGRLAFASEVKALLADPAASRGLRLETLDTYLTFGYMIGAETLFEGIDRLPPGHAMVVEPGAPPRLHAHWEFPRPTRGAAQAEGVIYQEARERLADSVTLHLRSDVPLGLFLSGGVDSAAVLALMAQQAGGRIKTFTVGFQSDTPFNELEQARRVAQHFQTEHHERVLSAEDWWGGLLQTVYAHDEPIANSSAVSLLLLAEDTAREVKVVLTGLGGDELFAGYGTHRAAAQLLRGGQRFGGSLADLVSRVEPFYPQLKRYRIVGALPTVLPRVQQAALPQAEALRRVMSFDGLSFSDALRAQLYGPELKAAAGAHATRAFAAILAHSTRDDPDDTALALVANTWLAGNALLHTDKVTMAHSLEARVPLFDPELIKFAVNIPPAVRMKGNKIVLREAMRPLLPAFALERPKQPFSTPILRWFDGDLNGHLREVLLDPNSFIRPYFDRVGLEKALHDHFWRHADQVELIFRLLTLELWGRRFVQPAVFAGAA